MESRRTKAEDVWAVAERILLSSGSAEKVSLSAVADALGAPVALSEMPDKAKLVREVSARGFEALQAAIEQALAGLDDPVEQLVARGRVHVRFARERPELYRVMFRTGPPPVLPVGADDEVVLARAYESLAANVLACLTAGERRPPDPTNPRPVCTAWWAVVHGWVSLPTAEPGCYLDDCIRSLVA